VILRCIDPPLTLTLTFAPPLLVEWLTYWLATWKYRFKLKGIGGKWEEAVRRRDWGEKIGTGKDFRLLLNSADRGCGPSKAAHCTPQPCILLSVSHHTRCAWLPLLEFLESRKCQGIQLKSGNLCSRGNLIAAAQQNN